MIAVVPGVAFTMSGDGDARHDPGVRARLDVPSPWATVDQVHGDRVVRVSEPGPHGPADGVVTSESQMGVAVFTADCLGIVLHSETAVGAVHAGWRGVVAGVIERAVGEVGDVRSAVIGPHIRPCCFEVGPEVTAQFAGHTSVTTWGTPSVDLASAATSRLPVEPQVVDVCTRCGEGTWSHRRDGTSARHAAIGWRP